MTENLFLESIAMLAELYDYKPSEQKVKLYFRVVKQYTDQQWKDACVKIISEWVPTTAHPFPSIPTLKEALDGNQQELGELAVSIVRQASGRVGDYKSISFEDTALHAAIQAFGGWPAMSRWTDEEWSYNRQRFIDQYIACRNNSIVGPTILVGLADLSYNSWHDDQRFVVVSATRRQGKIIYLEKTILQLEHKQEDQKCLI